MSNVEQISFTLKDEKQNICEEFLEFQSCYSEVTRAAIIKMVEQLGLDFRKMHDQAHVGSVSIMICWRFGALTNFFNFSPK